jgi:hypothetical protein
MHFQPMFAHGQQLAMVMAVFCWAGLTIGFGTAAIVLRKQVRAKGGNLLWIVGAVLGLALVAGWYVLLARSELLGL